MGARKYEKGVHSALYYHDHHFSYNMARIYARDGKSAKALKWLKRGFPCYTLFVHDPFLDAIRKDQAFTQFMAEMKTRWEGYRRD